MFCSTFAFHTSPCKPGSNVLLSAGEVKVHGNSLELSPVFKWYAGDFGGKQGTLQFLLDHTKGELHDSISRLKSKPDDLVEFQWQEYDWSSNAA